MSQTFVIPSDATPPWLLRLMAVEPRERVLRDGTKLPVSPIPAPRLAKRGGISTRTLARISWRSSWAGIDPRIIAGYLAACDIKPAHIENQVFRFIARHGDYFFHLAPNAMSQKKLQKLDQKLCKFCEREKK